MFSFLDSVSRLHEPGYRPTEQDILYSRVATTGVVEVKFMVRIGGERPKARGGGKERKAKLGQTGTFTDGNTF